MSHPIQSASPADILVIDDTPANLQLVVGLLRGAGYTARAISDSAMAVQVVERQPPDLILLDIRMPQPDGFAICSILKGRESTRDIPIIFLSALADAGDKMRAFEAGGVDYITKPFHAAEVLARVNAHVRLRQAKAEAERANRAKSAFLASMSHELRTPLNAILGFSQFLARAGNLGGEQLEYLRIIHRNGDHLLSMINQVLDLAKIEAGSMELDLQPCDPEGLVWEIGGMFHALARDKGLLFSTEIAPGMPSAVRIDLGKLRQMLINLLGNALKFTTSGGVSLHASSEEEEGRTWLFLEIADTGPGIPEQMRERIFDPFVQAPARPPGVGGAGGTGLGLAITRSLAERMGGTIELENRPGGGSRFTLRLPVAPLAGPVPAEQAPDLAGAEPLTQEAGAWRVLVAEDHEDSRRLLVELMSRAGFQVRAAADGREAVEGFRDWRPHFVWMDIRMPELDGCEATRRIRALPGGEEVKIAALTAGVFDEEREQILAAGCDAILCKPFRTGEALELVASLLGLSRRPGASNLGEPNAADSADTPDPTPEALAGLPEAMRNRLQEAVLSLDMEEISEAVVAIRPLAPTLADGLNRWLRGYRFDRLLTVSTAGAAGDSNRRQ